MSDEMKIQVHNILYKYCSDFLNVQEITHAANEIVNNPTENTILEMTTYLDSFDTMRNGSQSILQPTENVRAFTANNVRFAMSEIRKLVAASENSFDSSALLNILKAPLHDASETIEDSNLVSGYNVSVGTISSSNGKNIIPVTFSGTNLKKHTNGAGTEGYWMGIAIPDSVLKDGYTVGYKRGFGTDYSNVTAEATLSASDFEADSNIASSGKYCTFYREVGQAKENSGRAFVALSFTKNSETIYYIYDYNYSNVTLAE